MRRWVRLGVPKYLAPAWVPNSGQTTSGQASQACALVGGRADLVCSESQGGGGRAKAAATGRDGTPPRFTLSLLRCCYLNACRPPLSSYLSPTTTTLSPPTLSIPTPQQFASRLQIYSTPASPRYLNTPISVRRHLCRPSLPMSIENLKSYGQSFSVHIPIPLHKATAIPRCTACDCAADVSLRRTRHGTPVLSAMSTLESPQPWDTPRPSSHFPAFGLLSGKASRPQS